METCTSGNIEAAGWSLNHPGDGKITRSGRRGQHQQLFNCVVACGKWQVPDGWLDVSTVQAKPSGIWSGAATTRGHASHPSQGSGSTQHFHVSSLYGHVCNPSAHLNIHSSSPSHSARDVTFYNFLNPLSLLSASLSISICHIA